MNKILLPLFLLTFCKLSAMKEDTTAAMERVETLLQKTIASPTPWYPSRDQLIWHHIETPLFIDSQLKKYPLNDIINFRYAGHNNLLHSIVRTLVLKKDHLKNFDQLVNQYKPILRWLTQNGLDINEVNDQHATPLMTAYGNSIVTQGKEQGNELQPLINFLITDLHARITYASVDPELRTCKKFLYQLFCCAWCKRMYHDNEKSE